MDGHLLFSEAIELLKDDPVCRVRGLLAENLAAWIIRASTEAKGQLLHAFRAPVLRFLADDDTWPLENMFLLFNHLHEEGVDVAPFLAGATGAYLLPDSAWWTLERETFIAAIEARKAERSE